MIKTVFLDLDDTLFDFKASEKKAIRKTLLMLDIEPKEAITKRYSEINNSQWKLLELGRINRDDLKINRFKILFEELSVTRSPELAREIYEENLGAEFCFIDGAEELLESIHRKYNLYLASNGSYSVQKRRIDGAGIGKYFKDIFISQVIGHNKPSREFFDYCFGRIPDFDNNSTIIIGDSLSSDIRGGKNAKIKTCLYNPGKISIPSDITPDYEVASLLEIPKLLSSI